MTSYENFLAISGEAQSCSCVRDPKDEDKVRKIIDQLYNYPDRPLRPPDNSGGGNKCTVLGIITGGCVMSYVAWDLLNKTSENNTQELYESILHHVDINSFYVDLNSSYSVDDISSILSSSSSVMRDLLNQEESVDTNTSFAYKVSLPKCMYSEFINNGSSCSERVPWSLRVSEREMMCPAETPTNTSSVENRLVNFENRLVNFENRFVPVETPVTNGTFNHMVGINENRSVPTTTPVSSLGSANNISSNVVTTNTSSITTGARNLNPQEHPLYNPREDTDFHYKVWSDDTCYISKQGPTDIAIAQSKAASVSSVGVEEVQSTPQMEGHLSMVENRQVTSIPGYGYIKIDERTYNYMYNHVVGINENRSVPYNIQSVPYNIQSVLMVDIVPKNQQSPLNGPDTHAQLEADRVLKAAPPPSPVIANVMRAVALTTVAAVSLSFVYVLYKYFTVQVHYANGFGSLTAGIPF